MSAISARVAWPAPIVTVRVPTASSLSYSVAVYVPAWMPPIVYRPVVGFGVAQYCACALLNPTVISCPTGTLPAVPFSDPRCDAAIHPPIPAPSIHA